MTYWDDSQVPFDNHLSYKAEKEVKITDQLRGEKVIKRTRHSFYLDAALIQSLDQAYRRIHHELYPVEISKSDFLEACIRYALSHLQEIKCHLMRDE
jgi:hypothetical protein